MSPAPEVASASPTPTPSPTPWSGRPPAPDLREVAGRVRPVTLAVEQVLAVPGPLGALLPGGGLRRGGVVAVEGAPGAGQASLVLRLLASASAAGEWAAVVDPHRWLGAEAVSEAGVDLSRLAVVRGVDPARWGTTVAALLEGVGVVAAWAPRRLGASEARRLAARVRARRGVLVVADAWPAGPALRLRATGVEWPHADGVGELHAGGVPLRAGTRHVEIEPRGGQGARHLLAG